MKAGKQLLLGLVAITVASGCSSRTAPETFASQNEPIRPAAVAAAVSAVGAGGLAAQLTLGDATEVAKLRAIALGASSFGGVPSPQTMHAVAVSDHQAAATILSGAIINDHVPVYVIVITGGPFTAPVGRPGIAAPQSNVVTVTVDAATHRVTDVGYVSAEPDLSQIGSLPVDLSAT